MVIAEGDVEVLVGQVTNEHGDLALVDVLARLQLAVQRVGWSMRLVDPCPDVWRLLDLVGLGDVVGGEPGPGGESGLR